MKRGSKETTSVWREKERPEPSFSPLHAHTRADVCIVGAGIAGLSTGYLLAKEGKSVVIVDAWGLGAGETGRTTAHLTAVLDDRFFALESLYGKDRARLAADSHMAAINRIEAIVKEERIACDFERVDGYLAAPIPAQQKDIAEEAEAAQRVGFADREFLTRVPIEGVSIGPAVRFPQQATFHIMNYIIALAEAFRRLGGRFYTGSHVNEVKSGKNAYVKTDDAVHVDAQHIVVTTNTPINDRVTMHTKQAAYRTYVIGYQVPKDTYPGFLLWDMEHPYHYVRPVRGDSHDMLIIGGEDHKTGQANDADERYRRLDEWTRRYFSTLGPIAYRWSGQIMEPVDSLAFIGRNPGDEDNVYIATGNSGNGMTHGTIAGILITDLIQRRPNSWEKLYDPSRKSLKSALSFAEENVNAAGHLVKDWVTPAEVNSVDEIPAGRAAIMRSGASKTAVYRDDQGRLHGLSAVCTHLGCIVQWNGGEKSWDCPCHGSRFDTDGKILNGPAVKPLEPATVQASAGSTPNRQTA